MNLYKSSAVVTVIMLIVFIVIWILTDFSDIVLILGSVGVGSVIIGSVTVIYLSNKREALRREIEDFRMERSRKWKEGLSKMNFPYYCPNCPYRAYEYTESCPACGKSELKKIRKK
jgi:hypothetical protein